MDSPSEISVYSGRYRCSMDWFGVPGGYSAGAIAGITAQHGDDSYIGDRLDGLLIESSLEQRTDLS